MAAKKIIGSTAKRSLRRLGVLAGVLLLLGIVISAVQYKQKSLLSKVFVVNIERPDGNVYLNEEDVKDIIKDSIKISGDGLAIMQVDVKRIENILRRNQYIDKADAYIDARNKLHVDVTQRIPIVHIVDEKNYQYYLDKQGRYMKLPIRGTARIPLATGAISPFFPDYLQTENNLLYQLYQLVIHLYNDNFLNALVEQIYVTPNAEFVLAPKIGNFTIEVGTIEGIEEKLERLKIFYKEALPHKGLNQYSKISLKFKEQVVCTRK